MAFLSLSPSSLSKEIRAFLFGQDSKYSYKDKVRKTMAEAFLPLEELCPQPSSSSSLSFMVMP